ncbi:hypothetical protein BB561_003148 [Smittium simulii]|uniref:Uncharacterized protein n=1 Tax=Smittium simulii TaxID=133385 RepID=A0A2T9YMZ9_9FUNG|nr:hypothetical protein BB561_003148 [Smittium simulii]
MQVFIGTKELEFYLPFHSAYIFLTFPRKAGIGISTRKKKSGFFETIRGQYAEKHAEPPLVVGVNLARWSELPPTVANFIMDS